MDEYVTSRHDAVKTTQRAAEVKTRLISTSDAAKCHINPDPM